MGVYLWNRLPSEYQEVEYIQSDTSNVQYINTGYLPTSNPKIELDFMYINGVETTDYVWFDIYGRRGSTNSTYIGMYINNPNGYVSPNYAGFDPGQNSGVTISKNTRYYHIQDRGQFYLNGTKYANASTTNTLATANYPVFLFGNNIQGTVQGRVKSMRVYSCKMWNDGVLVRNFVPCYRKSDSVIGLYDLVNNQFYTNSGSGTFSKGSDVNTYRESSLKNAYIGEVYEYSYDFRNKSSSQVTADGYVTAAGTPAYNSNGFTSSNSSVARINKNIESLANAKKITLSFTVVLGSGATGTGIRLMGANRTYGTGVLFDVNSNLCQYFIGGDKVTDSSGLSSGTHTTTIVLNLTDKTAVFSRTGKTDYSTSITDTQISNIKNNITLSEIFAGMSAGVISNWYILVE